MDAPLPSRLRDCEGAPGPVGLRTPIRGGPCRGPPPRGPQDSAGVGFKAENTLACRRAGRGPP
ncbi:hypothetical protein Emag_005826 [Eimeria magna]